MHDQEPIDPVRRRWDSVVFLYDRARDADSRAVSNQLAARALRGQVFDALPDDAVLIEADGTAAYKKPRGLWVTGRMQLPVAKDSLREAFTQGRLSLHRRWDIASYLEDDQDRAAATYVYQCPKPDCPFTGAEDEVIDHAGSADHLL